MYETKVRVRFGDIDRAGIVYYPRVLNYLHVAFEEFVQDEVGIPYPDLLNRDRVGFPTVHLETDFRRPLEFGDLLRVQIGVGSVGRSSATFHYRIFRPRESEVAVEATVVAVAIDMDRWEPVPVPDAVRAALDRHRDPAA